MGYDIPKAERELKELCESLGLQFERQDWGIINADGQRLSEFVRYYEANPGLSATQKFELGELILASANERLVSGKEPMPAERQIFLRRNRNKLESQLGYWLNLREAEEFPVADWLRRYLSGSGAT